MKTMISAGFVFFLSFLLYAQDADKIGTLEKRIKELEVRVSKLESVLSADMDKKEGEKKIEQQRALARERMRKDSEIYSQKELEDIETLYQVANQKWQTQEGKDSLKKMIEKYDNANRTGCALLYLGQMSKGKEREEYLQKAIKGFSDCFYGDGVQVGAYARFYLGFYYKENGQNEKAEELFKEIDSKYPDAIDHKGRSLTDLLKK